MAAERGYRHIKVTPAEEQEVVIHAGAQRQPTVSEVPSAHEEASAGPRDADQAEASHARPQPPSQAQQPQDGYHATTLQDIKGSKMPKTQVAIIVVAVCAIIAFIVWYAFFS